MTTTDTPRTDAEPCNHPMLSAQSDPVGLYHKLIAVTVDFGKALDACVEYRKQLAASKEEVERLRGLLQQAVEIAEVFESELDEYHSVDRNCPDAAWHYPDGWERSEEAKDKLEALNKEIK